MIKPIVRHEGLEWTIFSEEQSQGAMTFCNLSSIDSFTTKNNQRVPVQISDWVGNSVIEAAKQKANQLTRDLSAENLIGYGFRSVAYQGEAGLFFRKTVLLEHIPSLNLSSSKGTPKAISIEITPTLRIHGFNDLFGLTGEPLHINSQMGLSIFKESVSAVTYDPELEVRANQRKLVEA